MFNDNIDYPEDINESDLLSLLGTEGIPDFNPRELKAFDIRGSYDSEAGDLKNGIVYKIIAAIGFEGFEMDKDACFSYDRATKMALCLRYNALALRTAKRAIVLHHKKLKADEKNYELLTNLDYAEFRFEKAAKRIGKTTVYSKGYSWFPNCELVKQS